MNPNLSYIRAQQRIADLQRAADDARLVIDAATRRRDSRDSCDSSPIVRALPMPTAHPSPEAWPDASLPAGYEPGPGQGPLRALPHHDRTQALDGSPHEGGARVACEVLADVS
jgi:hypothetical protein